MKKYLFFFAGFLMMFCKGSCKEVNERGYWIGDVVDWHSTDWKLAEAIVVFLKNERAATVVDFGCGAGDYTSLLLHHGFACIGYDGNPNTPILTKGVGQVLDLSETFHLGKTFDWVLCLEVGEHLPYQFEKILIDNLMRHTGKGIILSWAIKGQLGRGHFNCQDNDYIKTIFARHGYINDVQAEKFLREHTTFDWFKNTIMVFRKSPEL